MRATVLHDHEVPGRPPIRLAVGDPVTVGARDTQWPAFVLVTTPTGEGWVPARYLTAASKGAAMATAYDTTELAVVAGDEVTVLDKDEESGWWWCRSDGGGEGWVPAAAFGGNR